MVTYVQVVEVARLRARDADAFRLLIERLQQPITGHLYRLVRDREVALDLAQDTFLQVYQEIEKTSPDLALDAWIYRIATNYGLRYLNRKRLRRFVRLSFDSSPSPDEKRMKHSETSQDIGLAIGPSTLAIVARERQAQESKRSQAIRRQHASAERKLAAQRKSLHGKLVHDIVRVGKTTWPIWKRKTALPPSP